MIATNLVTPIGRNAENAHTTQDDAYWRRRTDLAESAQRDINKILMRQNLAVDAKDRLVRARLDRYHADREAL